MRRTARSAALSLVFTLIGRSAAAQIAVTSNAVVQHVAARGERFQGTLVIRNTSNAPQSARIVQSDYAFTADGRTSFGEPGSSPRSNARWISFSPREVVIPPGATVSVRYVVGVPDTAELRGTYWSLLMVERRGVTTPPVTGRPAAAAPGEIGLNVATRYATQIATHIGTSGAARLDVDSVLATTVGANTHRALRFDFANSGDRACAATLTAELFDETGRLVTRQTKARGLLYPGSSARQLFDVGSIAPGVYRVVITADAGGDELFGGTYRVRF